MTAPRVRVLFCDDLKSERSAFDTKIAKALAAHLEVESVSSFEGVKERIASGQVYDIVVTDLNFEKVGGGSKDGLRIVRAAREAWPLVEVVLYTAHPGFLHPTELLEASDLGLKRETWVEKVADDSEESWRKMETVLTGLCRLIEERRRARDYQDRAVADSIRLVASRALTAVEPCDRSPDFPAMVGKSPAMKEVYEKIRRVAPTPAPVLVTGPTGTGKELVARAIHHLSGRSGKPFLAVNCGEFNEDLLASELFGHARGAFTGAWTESRGLLVGAHMGTFLLDEVGEMSPANQAKFLRVLQEKRVRPVGGTESVPIDVRFLAATNRELATELRAGRFRQDLYDRLNIYRIHLPALAARREDVVVAAAHYFHQLAPRYGRSVRAVSEEALWKLVEYDWPENLRQLVNVVTHTLINLTPGRTRVEARDVDLASTALTKEREEEESGELFDRVLSGKVRSTLSDLANRFGEPATIEVVRRMMLHFNGLPPETETRRLFDMSYRNWQHWAHYHGLSWRKVKSCS